MSAEKKAQTRAERAEKRRQEEEKDRRSMMIYTVVAVLVVVGAIAAMFWRSGILQRNLTALDVNGVKYTAADLQYYYSSIYNEQAQRYAFDSTTSVKKQVYDAATGQTWYDYLVEQSVERLTRNTALARQAENEGYTLSEDAQNAINTALAQLETGWINYGYTNRDTYIRTNFGVYMTYNRLVALVKQEYTASDYAQAKLDAIEHAESDYTAYYQEHTDELDTVTFSQITFQAYVPTTDADGNAVVMTDEEKAAALEELKPAQKALAEEVQAKLTSGKDIEDLIKEYSEQLSSSSVSRATAGSSLSGYVYHDWLLESGRREGDVTVIEYPSGTSAYYYYVILFEGRKQDNESTHNVRHILVRAGDSSTANPTQEQYDAAGEKAQSILDQWKAGEATEESFIALVSANSDDTGSASSGGLYSNITSTSNYVETFRSWAVDPARKEGDTELVKSEYGWHIMYYVSTGEPVWRQSTLAALQNQDYEELSAAASQGMTVSRGMGMNFISA